MAVAKHRQRSCVAGDGGVSVAEGGASKGEKVVNGFVR